VWAWRNQGYVYENLGRYDEAIASYQEAIKVKPLSFLYISLGINERVRQNYDARWVTFKRPPWWTRATPMATRNWGSPTICFRNTPPPPSTWRRASSRIRPTGAIMQCSALCTMCNGISREPSRCWKKRLVSVILQRKCSMNSDSRMPTWSSVTGRAPGWSAPWP
ncbi:MAG: tetratricopeptide repeat protein, partial [Ardenticatenales bacterium]|nr:tetratricopeptide repeat protein [Ardenticatenales bacterium]